MYWMQMEECQTSEKCVECAFSGNFTPMRNKHDNEYCIEYHLEIDNLSYQSHIQASFLDDKVQSDLAVIYLM